MAQWAAGGPPLAFAGWSGQRPSHDRECGADQTIKNAGRHVNEAIAPSRHDHDFGRRHLSHALRARRSLKDTVKALPTMIRLI